MLLHLCQLSKCLGRQLSILLWRLILRNKGGFVLLLKIYVLFRAKHMVVLVWRGLQLGRLFITLTIFHKKQVSVAHCEVPSSLKPCAHQETEPHLSDTYWRPWGTDSLWVFLEMKCFLLAHSPVWVRTGEFIAHRSGAQPRLHPHCFPPPPCQTVGE